MKSQLASLNEAIKRIEEGAQEYRLSSNTWVRRGDLAALYSERRKLMHDIALIESSGGIFVAQYTR